MGPAEAVTEQDSQREPWGVATRNRCLVDSVHGQSQSPQLPPSEWKNTVLLSIPRAAALSSGRVGSGDVHCGCTETQQVGINWPHSTRSERGVIRLRRNLAVRPVGLAIFLSRSLHLAGPFLAGKLVFSALSFGTESWARGKPPQEIISPRGIHNYLPPTEAPSTSIRILEA